MEYDIIVIPQDEFRRLCDEQIKLLRAAQQKKNELVRDAEKEFLNFKAAASRHGMQYSDVIKNARAEIDARLSADTAVLADNLIYDMSFYNSSSAPPSSDEGYVVDYSLSYSKRYVAVRDYYMSIEDGELRLSMYAADETAKSYLSSYYSTLYNFLATHAG